ncbi:DUF4177 domain-containing protein [Flavobacterium filum]|uniref:DUF4177 domain-containing protein n=1 Tax=Flavobacterium filum TaxID=370974 RepID=UPI0023F5149D|nr:DUF4177 domain-containing protein [Flavobacterium filum]
MYYEYKVIIREQLENLMSEDELNEVGLKGWELVFCLKIFNKVHYHFKRAQEAN